jgi:hypothetical protein
LLRSVFCRHQLCGALFASSALVCTVEAAAADAVESAAPCSGRLVTEEARAARTWRYAWSGINAGFMVGSFVAVPLVHKEDRPDWIISGIGSGVTVLATWFFPLRVESAADELEALPAEQCQAQYPRLVRESWHDEQARVTWPWHVLNFGLSAGAGSIIAFGYGHYASGLVTTVAGTALGEAQILTQPTNLSAAKMTLRPTPRLAFTPSSGGLPAAWTLSVASAF